MLTTSRSHRERQPLAAPLGTAPRPTTSSRPSSICASSDSSGPSRGPGGVKRGGEGSSRPQSLPLCECLPHRCRGLAGPGDTHAPSEPPRSTFPGLRRVPGAAFPFGHVGTGLWGPVTGLQPERAAGDSSPHRPPPSTRSPPGQEGRQGAPRPPTSPDRCAPH